MDKSERADAILSFEELREDWDSYGAAPINRQMIEIAQRISSVLEGEWFPSPCCNGEICFESDDGAHIFVRPPSEARITGAVG